MPAVLDDKKFPQLAYELNAVHTPNIVSSELDSGFEYLTPDEVRRKNAIYDKLNKYGVMRRPTQVPYPIDLSNKDFTGDVTPYYFPTEIPYKGVSVNPSTNKVVGTAGWVEPTYGYDTPRESSLAAQAPAYQQDAELQAKAVAAFERRKQLMDQYNTMETPTTVVQPTKVSSRQNTQSTKGRPKPPVVGSGELAMRNGYVPVPAAMDRKSTEPMAVVQHTNMTARPEVVAPTQELVDRSTPSLSNMKPVPDWAMGTIFEHTGRY